ncbi:NAD(P)-dependent oxidoreductase [Rhodococcus sp. BP-349]|uniref:UDP-glucose 4-epimerase n=1 Tax=Rhodococcoides corynebacterioides TaxID=53972 RepID=A0ABS2KY31_9NOCA|nr:MULTISPECIES: NAD(P)-dependent oxidoreductase [Rhodococcus]MBM7416812.1 UDP-glucose 4-epimerase [Rhodococcus corynebacterioides]MBP1115065.1 UDP-glucose 4-epimerase [Rhodococcus sp. PvP016]MBY6537083.1 NAD(P)-dependent oxidoreductase [Rhodococcus sp. BP-363]MBY6541420.1 NAD(P)-dependent oxidoreductase [Rhodococcus sp. BP-369]MBY6560650.1 NAD(P)-dependent oxidoreductase [Rhodococcus sp. BP-370]
MTTLSWVVGSGGLLGSAVSAELVRRGHRVVTETIPWLDEDAARTVITSRARAVATSDARRVNVVWCAGAGVNGTPREAFDRENDLFAHALAQLESYAVPRPEPVTVFHASSAGGVYAGTPDAPHDESSAVAPLGEYGHAKLRAEQRAVDFGRRTDASVVVGRFANLYGPGQNLSKPQGLISHLCRGYLLASPISIYVPIDTLRDYLYISDAAEMVADALDVAARERTDPVTKIFASGNAVTIGAILGACRSVFRRRPLVVQAASPLSSLQGRDLRLRSTVWPEIDRRTHRTLPAGIASTLESIRSSLLAGHRG